MTNTNRPHWMLVGGAYGKICHQAYFTGDPVIVLAGWRSSLNDVWTAPGTTSKQLKKQMTMLRSKHTPLLQN
jgi:hypothetical protein